jgi:SNF2 family DNA or RNA helicase
MSQINLLDYQKQIVDKTMADLDNYQASINCCEQGLGKTVMTLSVIESRNPDFILIVAPKITLKNWIDEVKKFTSKSVMLFNRSNSIDDVMNYDIVVTNYELLYHRGYNGSLESCLHNIDWDLIIFDECHNIKNVKTKKFQSATLLHGSAKILLSGTPISASTDLNISREFHAYIEILRIDTDEFKEIFQRKLANSVNALPQVKHENLALKMDTQHEAIYNQLGLHQEPQNNEFDHKNYIRDKLTIAGLTQHLIEYILRPRGIAGFSRKKYITSNPNMVFDLLNNVALQDYTTPEQIQRFDEKKLTKINKLKSLIKPNDKCLIITNYKNENELIYNELTKLGYNVAQINGDTKQDARDEIIEKSKFKFDEIFNQNTSLNILPFDIQTVIHNYFRTDVVVANISTVSTGINLQHFNKMILYGIPNSLINYSQVMSRIVRIGSPHTNVNIYNLIYEDTVEVDILEKHNKKLNKMIDIENYVMNL